MRLGLDVTYISECKVTVTLDTMEFLISYTNDDFNAYFFRMSRNNQRKTTRGIADQLHYEHAAQDHLKKKLSIRKSSKKYNLCHVSLSRCVKNVKLK